MPGSFQEALAENPAPRRLGDVSIRYEPSLLIGEADRPPRGLLFATALVVGVAFAVGTAGALLTNQSNTLVGLCAAATGAAFFACVQLDQIARRQRRFVLNFGTTSLRLDFSTPILNHPRTLVVHFDGVKDCAVITQGDGQLAITVDFLLTPDSPTLLREVLVANVPAAQEAAAQRLHHTLSAAFGLGEVPADSPALAAAAAPAAESSFEPKK